MTTENRPRFLRNNELAIAGAIMVAAPLIVIALTFLACALAGEDDTELKRHEKAFNGTYLVPSPWQNPAGNAKQENPEDGKHIRTVPGRG